MTGSPSTKPTHSDHVEAHVDQNFDLTGIFEKASFQQIALGKALTYRSLDPLLSGNGGEVQEAVSKTVFSLLSQMEQVAFKRQAKDLEQAFWRLLCLIDLEGEFSPRTGPAIAAELWALADTLHVPKSDMAGSGGKQ